MESLGIGDHVAALICGSIYLALVEEVEEGVKVDGTLKVVPDEEQYGGWGRRPWVRQQDEGGVLWKDGASGVSNPWVFIFVGLSTNTNLGP